MKGRSSLMMQDLSEHRAKTNAHHREQEHASSEPKLSRGQLRALGGNEKLMSCLADAFYLVNGRR